MRTHAWLRTATEIINRYSGSEPLNVFLRKFFAADKKFGSTDRRNISQLCYSFYRLGRSFPAASIAERIVKGLFLVSASPNDMLASFSDEFNQRAAMSIAGKIEWLNEPLFYEQFLSFDARLSEGVDTRAYAGSFFIQPQLFLRLRPGHEITAPQKLEAAQITFQKKTGSCVELAIGSKIEAVLRVDREVVVQDYSSQRIREVFESIPGFDSDGVKVWDACAGSGGKSLLFFDLNPAAELTVSDIRSSILANLRKRFSAAGIDRFKGFVTDLAAGQTDDSRADAGTKPGLPLGKNSPAPRKKFDIIICDAPCTGSGTWARTPEQLYFFDKSSIAGYVARQRAILQHLARHLKPGGHLIYITCSVFFNENEANCEFIGGQAGLQQKQQWLLTGYHDRADTLFAALFEQL
ncbi:MAG TPA: methyltransferase domain-containing protein [Chitinophagaceae bacterium]